MKTEIKVSLICFCLLSLHHNSKPKRYGHVQSNTTPQQRNKSSTPNPYPWGVLPTSKNTRQVRDKAFKVELR